LDEGDALALVDDVVFADELDVLAAGLLSEPQPDSAIANAAAIAAVPVMAVRFTINSCPSDIREGKHARSWLP
jgi:hypothetical protein